MAGIVLRYVGASHERSFSAADFRRVGVEDQNAIKVEQEGEVEVSKSAAKYLLENEGGAFVEANGN